MVQERSSIEVTKLVPGVAGLAAVDQIVALHRSTFPSGVLSQLGNAFVRNYYRHVLNARSGNLWVVIRGGRDVLAFLACTTDRRSFGRENRGGAAKRALLWRLLTLRMSPRAVMRALKKKRLSRGLHNQAELLAIAVAPAHRREGLGRRLVAEWEERLRSEGVNDYLVFTDNEEGYSFYRRCGGECLFEFRLAGEVSAAFRMPVSQGA